MGAILISDMAFAERYEVMHSGDVDYIRDRDTGESTTVIHSGDVDHFFGQYRGQAFSSGDVDYVDIEKTDEE